MVLLAGLGYLMLSLMSAGSVATIALESPDITPERLEQIHRWFSLSQALRYPVEILESVFSALGVPHFFLISTFLVGMIFGLMLVLLRRQFGRKSTPPFPGGARS